MRASRIAMGVRFGATSLKCHRVYIELDVVRGSEILEVQRRRTFKERNINMIKKAHLHSGKNEKAIDEKIEFSN